MKTAAINEDDVTDTLAPLTAFTALATHFEQVEVDFVHLELGLKDPRSQDVAENQVLVTWQVVRLLVHTEPVWEVLGSVSWCSLERW
ncbi:hypothetical protein I79_000055 [Cricetulus griseus]|uniref:Uncharacterized protein n=1 Tax=Cricetulus griseus TaxID=10029 RepID=G3GRB2_CRIGR|nr:hypothetical protein I79_000055 [Cricetulus griseus]